MDIFNWRINLVKINFIFNNFLKKSAVFLTYSGGFFNSAIYFAFYIKNYSNLDQNSIIISSSNSYYITKTLKIIKKEENLLYKNKINIILFILLSIFKKILNYEKKLIVNEIDYYQNRLYK